MQGSAYPAAAMPIAQPNRGDRVAIALSVGLSLCAIGALAGSHQGALLRMVIPAAAMVVAIVLYFKRPIAYVQYTLWVWFLVPFVRRLVDWLFGFADPNFVLLSPFLVAAVSGFTLLRPGSHHSIRIPPAFIFCATAIFYGFVVGMVLRPGGETIYGLVNWLSPLLFGLHLCLRWKDYEQHREAICRTFILGVFVMGAYGIYQYVFAPEWDIYWLFNVQDPHSLAPSFGQPEPFLLRIWSTLNSPGPFADVMMVGLLLLLTIKSKFKLVASLAGYITLLLSSVRTAWIGYLVGLVIIMRKSQPKLLIRLALFGALMGTCLLFFVKTEPVHSQVADRFESLTSLKSDESYSDRQAMYQTLTIEALRSPFGQGVSNANEWHNFMIDSGVLLILLSFGWFGTVAFVAGVVLFLLQARKQLPGSEGLDQFQIACRAICIGLLMQIVGGNIFTGVLGALFWIFAGMIFAGQMHDAQEPVFANGRKSGEMPFAPLESLG